MPALRNSQRAFTLIELMVVVVIVAALAGIAVLAWQLAADRPVRGRARELEGWLQSLSDRSLLENNAYGIRSEDHTLRAMVWYRQHWFPLQDPAPFILEERFITDFGAVDTIERSGLPPLIFRRGQPEGSFSLAVDNSAIRFELEWLADSGTLQLAGVVR